MVPLSSHNSLALFRSYPAIILFYQSAMRDSYRSESIFDVNGFHPLVCTYGSISISVDEQLKLFEMIAMYYFAMAGRNRVDIFIGGHLRRIDSTHELCHLVPSSHEFWSNIVFCHPVVIRSWPGFQYSQCAVPKELQSVTK